MTNMKKKIDIAITLSMGILAIAGGQDSSTIIERMAWYIVGIGLIVLSEIKRN